MFSKGSPQNASKRLGQFDDNFNDIFDTLNVTTIFDAK